MKNRAVVVLFKHGSVPLCPLGNGVRGGGLCH